MIQNSRLATDLGLNTSYQVEKYRQLGRNDLAFATVQQGLAMSPNSSILNSELGALYADANQNGLAVQAYQKALQLNPDNDYALFNYAKQLADKGLYQTALPFIQKAVRLNPHQAFYYEILGNSFGALGRADLAAKAYVQQIQLSSTSQYPQLSLANGLKALSNVFSTIKQFKPALALAKLAVQANPSDDSNQQFFKETQARFVNNNATL